MPSSCKCGKQEQRWKIRCRTAERNNDWIQQVGRREAVFLENREKGRKNRNEPWFSEAKKNSKGLWKFNKERKTFQMNQSPHIPVQSMTQQRSVRPHNPSHNSWTIRVARWSACWKVVDTPIQSNSRQLKRCSLSPCCSFQRFPPQFYACSQQNSNSS